MYCERCQQIVEEAVCPTCNSSRLREPKEKDPCFLTEQDFIHTGILEDVLGQNNIPYLRKNVLGAGMAIKVGPMLERGRFYVPYELLPKAQELLTDLFVPDDESIPME
jgi:hypothetical protein